MSGETSLHLEPIERMAMGVIRNPSVSDAERAAAIAVLEQLAPALSPNERRITDWLVLTGERLHARKDIEKLLRVLRQLAKSDVERHRALARLARRAWEEGAIDTWEWLIASHSIPIHYLDPAWLAARPKPRLGARIALALSCLEPDVSALVEKGLAPWIAHTARAEDLGSLELAARADIVFALSDMRSAESRALARMAMHVLRARGALVVGLASHDAEEGPASARFRGERGSLGHAFLTLDAPSDKEGHAARLIEIAETMIAPMVHGAGAAIELTRMRSRLRDGGHLRLGIGRAQGFARASIASERAMDRAELDAALLERGSYLLVHVTSSEPVTIGEIDEIAASLRDRLGDSPSIAWTSQLDESLDGASLRVAVLATRTTTSIC